MGVYYDNLNKTDSALQRNTKARSRNHFCHAKAVSIIYHMCLAVFLL